MVELDYNFKSENKYSQVQDSVSSEDKIKLLVHHQHYL